VNLTVTDLAQQRLADIVGDKLTAEHAIRVFIAAGGGCGCSGPSFGMGLDTPTEEDTVLEFGALRFAIDPTSAASLNEASIDFIEDTMQEGFQITAPNAQSGGGCGCGGGGAH
jgi:iron-sulfur cluster assembly accessory protein